LGPLLGIAHDAAVPGGIQDGGSQNGDTGAGRTQSSEEFDDGRGFQEGVVAIKDKEPVDPRQGRESALHRMTSAARRVLDHADDVIRALEPSGKIGGFRSDDKDADIWLRTVPGP